MLQPARAVRGQGAGDGGLFVVQQGADAAVADVFGTLSVLVVIRRMLAAEQHDQARRLGPAQP